MNDKKGLFSLIICLSMVLFFHNTPISGSKNETCNSFFINKTETEHNILSNYYMGMINSKDKIIIARAAD